MTSRCPRCEAMIVDEEPRCRKCGLAFAGETWRRRLVDGLVAWLPWLAVLATAMFIVEFLRAVIARVAGAGFVG